MSCKNVYRDFVGLIFLACEGRGVYRGTILILSIFSYLRGFPMELGQIYNGFSNTKLPLAFLLPVKKPVGHIKDHERPGKIERSKTVYLKLYYVKKRHLVSYSLVISDTFK